MRSAFHPLLGRFRIGASRLRPLFPKLHTSDCSSACPGSSTWVDKVPSRDTPSLNLADHRKGVFPGDPQVTHQQSGKTIVLVTHNVREAVCLGDRVVLMAVGPGRIIRAFDIPLPRPRDINSPELAGSASEIAAALKGRAGTAASE